MKLSTGFVEPAWRQDSKGNMFHLTKEEAVAKFGLENLVHTSKSGVTHYMHIVNEDGVYQPVHDCTAYGASLIGYALVSSAYYDMGFLAGIDAYEAGIYNCESGMEYLKTFAQLEHNTPKGQEFIRGWKDVID